VHFFGPFLYRSQFHATTEAEECERALQHLADIIAMEGPQTIAAIMLEAIPGTAGIMVPPPGYLSGVRALCDQHGIVLIADEVMSGFGRSGRWFASELDGLVPDLLTFAKGVNSGYVPLGGVAISAEIAATFDERVYPGGLTYSGHPLACAAAVATIRTMQDDRVVEHAAALGDEVFAPGLAELARKHEWVGEVRGTGAFWAIELVKDKATREPLAPYGGTSPAVNSVVAECKKRGMLPFVNFNRVHLVPPLTTSALEVTEAIEILDEALTAAAG
jgi:taurine--2-oxoglutarate transaminase